MAKPEDDSDPQYWVDGIAYITTSSDGEHNFWMEHTVHTPPISAIQIVLWAQLDPTEYVAPDDPVPLVIQAVVSSAGGPVERESEMTDENAGEGDNEGEGEGAAVDTDVTNLAVPVGGNGDGGAAEEEDEEVQEEEEVVQEEEDEPAGA